MPVVRKCLGGCGRDIAPPSSRCAECGNAQRRARRNPGYDDPRYRNARRVKTRSMCEVCHTGPATTVHHRDGNPQNNRDANLLGCCAPCAREQDRLMRKARDRV